MNFQLLLYYKHIYCVSVLNCYKNLTQCNSCNYEHLLDAILNEHSHKVDIFVLVRMTPFVIQRSGRRQRDGHLRLPDAKVQHLRQLDRDCVRHNERQGARYRPAPRDRRPRTPALPDLYRPQVLRSNSLFLTLLPLSFIPPLFLSPPLDLSLSQVPGNVYFLSCIFKLKYTFTYQCCGSTTFGRIRVH